MGAPPQHIGSFDPPQEGDEEVDGDENSPLQPQNGRASMALPDGKDGGLFIQLKAAFGFELLATLCVSQHLTKGFINSFVAAGKQYVFQQYAIPAPQVAVYSGVIQLPWAIKPVLGVLSDLVPIYGYAKSPYLVLAGILGCISLATLGTVQRGLRVDQVVILLFVVSLFVSTVDLLTEAAYASVLRQNPVQGPRLMSYVWGGMTIAGVFATLGSGWILSQRDNESSPWLLYSIASGPAAIIIFPAVANWLGEEHLNAEAIRARREKIFDQKEALFLCFIMLLATLTLLYTGMMFGPTTNAITSIVVLVVVLTSFSLLLNPIIAKVNAFSLIQTSLSLNIGAAGFYFAMDNEEVYPDGPHFSRSFYNIVLPLAASVFTLLGIWLYQTYSNEIKYTTMTIAGNLVMAALSMLDVCFYARLNKRWGVDDHVMILGTSAFETTLQSWLWMPCVVILAQMCPRGMEATMYALLAGCHNLGNTISSNFGAVLMIALGVKPHGDEGEGQDTVYFENLWKASMIASMLPLITVALVPWMIPAKRQVDPILPREDMPATEGSWWRTRFSNDGAVPEV
jgi:MFS family permease